MEWTFDPTFTRSEKNNILSIMLRTRTQKGMVFSAASDTKMEHIKLQVQNTGNLAYNLIKSIIAGNFYTGYM